MNIIIEISARHIHLSQQDMEGLFGVGYKLHRLRRLTQRTDFAAKETVTLKTSEGEFKDVRVVGPVRKQTQVEISRTDARFLGLNPPVRISGDLAGSSGATLVGPMGEVNLTERVIIAQRHIHAELEDAENYNLKNGQEVSVLVGGPRGLIFHNVKVRVGLHYIWRMHIDTDEGNAVDIDGIGEGTVIG